MRIITGEGRGRKLLSVPGEETRPTSERNKESIFNAIQFDIQGRRVLDLFAGTGQLGIEALSRGAKDAVFVDAAAAAVRVIRENLKRTGFEDRGEVIQADYRGTLGRFGENRFGLIFVDPPYEGGLLRPAVAAVLKKGLLMPGGLLVCEGAKEEELPERQSGSRILKSYLYGRTKITLYLREASDGEPGETDSVI